MAELKAARGGAALDAPAGFHEVGTVQSGGVTGTYEVWADLHDLRSRHARSRKHHQRRRFRRADSVVGGPGRRRADELLAEGLASVRLGTYLTILASLHPDRFPARFEYRGR